VDENVLNIVKNSQYIYFQVSRRLAEETWVDQGKDGEMDVHEDRTKQKMEYTLLLLVLLLMIVVLMTTVMTT